MRPDEPGAATAPPEATPASGAPESGATETPATAGNAVTTEHFDRILNRVEEMGGNVDQLMQRLPAPEETPGSEEDPVTALLAELGYEVPEEPEPEPEGLDQRELLEMVMAATNKAVEKQLKDQLHPHLSALQDRELDSAFADLESRYPKLVEDEEWQQKVLDTAEQLARGDRSKLEDPTFIELVHKSLLADERAANETPVGDEGSGLESPSGANPASSSGESEQDQVARIVRGGQSEGRKRLQDAGIL